LLVKPCESESGNKENLKPLTEPETETCHTVDVVKLRTPQGARRPERRCHSELTSPSTAELLAKFVASRIHEKPEPIPEPRLTTIHAPLPRSREEQTIPIMSVHKETGILQGRHLLPRHIYFAKLEKYYNY